MARKRMVTRTVTGTRVNVLCLDTVKCEPFNKEVIITGTGLDDKKLLKEVKKVVDTDEITAVKIVDTESVETLYGMDEQKFIELAEVLPPRGTKADETEETANE